MFHVTKSEFVMRSNADKKLGKLAPKVDERNLKLAKYLCHDTLPSIPDCGTWATKVDKWPMMGNDHAGDCTCAGAGHLIQEWTANAGQMVVLPDSEILKAYSAISGYDPKTGANDNGAYEQDVLKYWRNIGIGGHKIGAFVQVDVSKLEEVKAAIYLFGGIYIGVALPVSAQKQVIWDVVGNPADQKSNSFPGSWGGHCVMIPQYDTGFTCVTWGELQYMTAAFWSAYVDEAYAILSMDFIMNHSVSPAGFNLAELQKDLNLVTK